jgi:hypothetical protein
MGRNNDRNHRGITGLMQPRALVLPDLKQSIGIKP